MTGKKIFYVEDNEVLGTVLEWRLLKLGYVVCGKAATGDDAIAGIQECKPDLVILDIELRGDKDGINVGEYLRDKTTIPFIYLTSHSEDEYMTRAKKTGPKGYVRKPVKGDELRIALTLAL
jgi:DNA-binding response OmpR family regulator